MLSILCINQPDTIRDYIESDGYCCYHCQSKHLIRGVLTQDERGVTQTVTCKRCNEEWCDVYALVKATAAKGA